MNQTRETDGAHFTGPAECRLCAYEWVAVFPLGTDPESLECPKCGYPDGMVKGEDYDDASCA